jgi:hypothetical protein
MGGTPETPMQRADLRLQEPTPSEPSELAEQEAGSMAEELAGEIVLVDLSAIKRNPHNANYHTADQVQLLAQNIKRYGLRNAIELNKVAESDGHQYEILTGEGRFLAYCHLRDTEVNGEWTRIPAVIREDEGQGKDISGKRLSENALRWFNWAAECIEFASLRAAGQNLQDLMNTFGYGKSTIYNMVAVGQCLTHLNLTKEPMFQLTGKLTREDFIKYILPLRDSPQPIQSRKGQKGFKEAPDGSYDYAEVKACVRALLSNELTVEDLPRYSEEHRPSAKKNGSVMPKAEQRAHTSFETDRINNLVQVALNKAAEQEAGEAPDTIKSELPSESHPFVGCPGIDMFHLGDCIEQAKLYKDNTVQLMICDPPYGLGEEGEDFHAPYNKRQKGIIKGYVPAPDDYDKFSLDWMTEAKRILKPRGSLYIVISHKRLIHILNAGERLNLNLINHII